MDKFDHIQQLHRLLVSHKHPISMTKLADTLELSSRQVRRHIDTLRDRCGAPLSYDNTAKGWHYNTDEAFELPSLWLTADELQSLSLVLAILKGFESAALSDSLKPIETTIHKLLRSLNVDATAFASHVKALPIGNRRVNTKIFNKVAEAALHRKQITLQYSSYSHKQTQRTVSPQNILYYRDNWYLDAYCHLRNELRTFSIARIETAELTKHTATQCEPDALAQHFASSYGIFAGAATRTAKLRFSPAIAREIALQQWHPKQLGHWDGSDYLLEIPFSDEKELLQDLLRHTPHVYVETPVKLRKALQSKLQQGLELQLGKGLGWL